MYYSPRMPLVTFPVLKCSHVHISELIKHWSQIWMLTIQRWFDLWYWWGKGGQRLVETAGGSRGGVHSCGWRMTDAGMKDGTAGRISPPPTVALGRVTHGGIFGPRRYYW